MNRRPFARLFVCAGVAGCSGMVYAEGDFDVFGHVALSAAMAPDVRSWRQDGAGRYLDDDPRLSAHLGWRWQPALEWDVLVHARADTDAARGASPIGLVEAFATRRFFHDSGAFVQVKAGQFFLPTSREAVDPLWQSPYTQSLSALNSWIAEEFRPIGVDVAWRTAPDSRIEGEAATTVFVGNDSAGALLAWRGFASHDRLSVLGEILALPALPTLASDFSGQRDDGSKPFGPDLDGRVGYAVRARLGLRDHWRVLAALVDNRGDRALYRGEYAWATRFAQFGAEWWPAEGWTIAAEHLVGQTGMGLPSGPRVDADIEASYVLADWQWHAAWRSAVRVERFRIDDRDGVSENNGDRGDGITVSVFWQPHEDWRLGLEWQEIDSDHAASELLGIDRDTAGRAVRAELRWYF